MATSGLKVYTRDDGIRVFAAQDTSQETIAEWERAVTQILDACTTPEKHLYDFRKLNTLSPHALRAGVRAKSHPNLRYVYVAIMIADSRLVDLLNMVITIQAGGTFRIIPDEEEAIAWLNSKVAP